MDSTYLSDVIFGAPVWFWLAFAAVISGILVFDLGYLNKRARVLTFSQSVLMTSAYMLMALAFGVGVWQYFGQQKGALYFTALILEQSLSIDNVFVMSLIFGYFMVPRQHRHRVLFWGILAAIILRALFIGFGTVLVMKFEWLLYVFAVFLVYSGFKMMWDNDEEPDLSKNKAIAFLSRNLNVTPEIHGERFFVKKENAAGKVVHYATPVFLAFMAINVADIVFAVDSVPAVLSMTQDPFIVYTSNIFAILGLRALYFVIDALIAKFHYLKKALSILLIFVGVKIFWDKFVGHLDPIITLGFTLTVLAGAILLSLAKDMRARKKHA